MYKDNIEYIAKDLVIRKLTPFTSDYKLICFPPAGGSSLSFKTLTYYLDKRWEVWAIDPPGHALSKGEPFTSVNQMADYYFKKLQFLYHDKYYLLGHSLGGLVAYELTKRLEIIGASPEATIICASQPPHRIIENKGVSELQDRDLINKLVELNGVSKKLAMYDKLVKLYLPTIRMDLYAFENFKASKLEGKIKTPTLIFGGKNDSLVNINWISEWNHYCKYLECFALDGDHFVIESAAEQISNILREKILN